MILNYFVKAWARVLESWRGERLIPKTVGRKGQGDRGVVERESNITYKNAREYQ